MEIILENVIKGDRVTGVAKIMDGEINVNNVPFSVRTKTELDEFCLGLLATQTDFADISNGGYVPASKVIKKVDPAEATKLARSEVMWHLEQAKKELEVGLLTQAEYDAETARIKSALNVVKSK